MSDNEFYKTQNQTQINILLVKAAQIGDLKTAEYLLTSEDLDLKAQVCSYDAEALVLACHEGHLEIVKLLMSQAEFFKHPKAAQYIKSAVLRGCSFDRVSVVGYILGLDSAQAQRERLMSEGFIRACTYLRMSCIEWFIFKENIEFTDEIKEKLDIFKQRALDQKSKASLDSIVQMFEAREQKNKLLSTMQLNNSSIKDINEITFKI